MHDPLETRLTAWSEEARRPLPMPTSLSARVRRRRIQRLAPPILTGAGLVLILAATLFIAVNQGPARPVAPWSGPSASDLAFDPQLPLLRVRWAPAQPLRAGTCRTPECVESWFEGG